MEKRIGRYQVMETLGQGGMGVVYRASDPELEREVAIKVVLGWAQFDEEAMARFNREARIVAQLQHPHIVTVFDAGRTEADLPYFVMEYLEGTDLGEVLRQTGGLPATRALRYAIQVCEALEYAHARGIVHRDIKPANLLITPDDNVKVVDFGIARMADSRLTMSGVSMGTPLYMAPEQVAGKTVDHRADIFAMGSVVYALLSGRSPFDAPTLGAICHKIETEEPEPLSKLGVVAPRELDSVLRRALEKDPADRYQSAGELGQALQAAGASERASGQTFATTEPARTADAPTEPLATTGGRHRWIAAASVAVVALIVLMAWPESPLRPGSPESGGPTTTAQPPEPGIEIPEGPAPGQAEPIAPATPPETGTASTEPAATSEDPATADDRPAGAAEEPDRQRPALGPVNPAERAAVTRLVSDLERALEARDAEALARLYGGTIPARDRELFNRLQGASRLQIRTRLDDVRRGPGGTLIATVELGASGQTRRSTPRRSTLGMVFHRDEAGQLKLRNIVAQRSPRN